MESGSKSVVIPADLAVDVEEIIGAIRSAAEHEGHPADEAVRVVRTTGKGMLPGVVETAILIVGPAASWFTSKWLDAFVWPRIQAPLRKPSERAVDFVLKHLHLAQTEQGPEQHGGRQS